MNERQKNTLHHVKRLQGQLNTLERYIMESKSCKEKLHLATSISKSIDSLRFRMFEGYLINNESPKESELTDVINLLKK